MTPKRQLQWHSPREKPKLITYLLEIICILGLFISNTRCEGETNVGINISDNDKNLPPVKGGGPRDYAYSSVGSRVRDLTSFFESMSREPDSYDSGSQRQQSVIISLSEAASKLHLLSAGYPLEIKCNKYVKLITRPNIRTFATINLLMQEAKLFNEMEQNDANLVARLSNERGFDALGKLQTIIQTLESERENMRSAFEPSVQKDLLDCMNYYIYRHQRAISGVTYHVREQRDKLLPVIAHPLESEIVLRKFQALMDDTVKLETKFKDKRDHDCEAQWIDNLSKLHNLLLENQYEVPILVQEFVTDSKRLGQLISCNQILNLVEDLEQKLLEIESSEPDASPRENPEYTMALTELHNLSESNNMLLHDETHHFVHEPKRWKILNQSEGVESPRATEILSSPQSLENELKDSNSKEDEVAQNSGLFSKLEVKAPVNFEQVVVEETPIAHSDDKNVSEHGEHHVQDSSSEEVCQKLSNQQDDNLRLTSWGALEIDQALELAESLNKFKIGCATNERNLINTDQSRWTTFSMTRKLSSWCSRKLRDPSLTDRDRTNLLRSLGLLYGEGHRATASFKLETASKQ